MKVKIMKTSITSDAVLQNTICREMGGYSKDCEVPEIATILLGVSKQR